MAISETRNDASRFCGVILKDEVTAGVGPFGVAPASPRRSLALACLGGRGRFAEAPQNETRCPCRDKPQREGLSWADGLLR